MAQSNEVVVWDPVVRLFHWALVTAFFFDYFTGEDLLTLHVWVGYLVLGLIAFRVVWGFIGSPHARFSDFTFSPATTLGYVKDLVYLRPKRYLGHNPAGAIMVFALLLCLLGVTISGLAVYGADQHAGPLAGIMAGAGEGTEHALEELHEFLANLAVALVVMHLGGVLLESVIHRENLARAMVTGRKRA